MARTFLSRMSDEQIVEALLFATKTNPDDVIRTTVERDEATAYVTVRADQELDDGTGTTEYYVLDDHYEVDDYCVTTFDWSDIDGGVETNRRWRAMLHKLFGRAYATRALMTL